MQTKKWRIKVAILCLSLGVAFTCPAKVIYVDADATGANNGSNWTDAYRYLQNALADANFAAKPVEIIVAGGAYRPDEDTLHPSGVDEREATFQLLNGVAIKGGYAGFGQPDPNDRDIGLYETILSGDLDGSMGELTNETFFDVMVPRYSSTAASYHVVVADRTDSSAVLDGFTITGGVANGLDWDPVTDIRTYDGGGIYCRQANPTIIDCTIRGNCVVFHAGGPAPMGGGMHNQQGNPTLIRCIFELNAADDFDSDSWAAGLMNYCGNVRLTDCVFAYNRTYTWGGGLANMGTAILERCAFVGNFARNYGGAIYNESGLLILSNCLLEQNSSGWYPGGGIINFGSCEVSNCTFVGNTNYAFVHWPTHEGDRAIVRNSILWNDGNEITEPYEPIEVEVAYSDVQGGWPGEGNIDADPLFVDVDGGNYRLQRGSPCVNTGDNSAVGQGEVDMDGQPRIVNNTVDMGAYEYQQRATKVIYVDADASGAEDGSSWADAFMYLQDALRVATGSDRILVAEGVYRPDQGIYQPPCERTATFQLISGVAVQGGYAGFGQPDPNARDIELYETILSGDLRGNDPEFDSSEWQGIFDFTSDPNRAENSYSVVTGSGTDSAAVLDGFTITGGNANGPILGRCPDIDYRLAAGAGMYNACGSPTVLNCIFRRNMTRSPYGCSGSGCPAEVDAQALAAAGGFYCSCASFTTYLPATCGAGMFNCSGSPTLQNCRFEENISYGADAFSAGGGMFNLDSDPVLVNCTFTRNLVTGFDSEYYGGAVYDHSSTSTFTNCSFINNDSHQGGALYSGQESAATISNCLFAGNSAQHGSSAIHSSGIRLDVAGSTFAGNRGASWGGGHTIDCDNCQKTSLKVVNCILWNGANEVSSDLSDVEITFSDIEGGWEGQGNINVDPRFAQPGRWDDNGTPDTDHDDFWVDGDYHLKSQAGRWNKSEGRWTIDEVTSPCIDASDPLGPIGFEPFPNGGIVNMGAYGATAEASKSYFGKPPCELIIAGDINGDCEIDFKDFAIMALHWLEDINE